MGVEMETRSVDFTPFDNSLLSGNNGETLYKEG